MRLFIAFDVPEKVEKELRRLQEGYKGVKGISLAKEPHLTLKFLGEVDKTKAYLIKENLRKVKFNSFKVGLDKVGAFPNEKHIRVIWVGLKDRGRTLELHNKIDDALAEVFDKDKRFSPHLTIARIKFGSVSLNKEEVSGEFEVKEFKLYESIFVNDHHEYKCLEIYNL